MNRLLRPIHGMFNVLLQRPVPARTPLRLLNLISKYSAYPNHLKLSMAFAVLYLLKTQVICMEDAILLKARKKIDNGIAQMKQEFGTQMASYPSVIYSIRGPKYQIEFLVDQRKCDIFAILISALNVLDRDKETNGFQVVKVDSMKDGMNYTVQLQFTEAVGNPKARITSKGTIYISGEMTNERPSFKFVLEKSDDISEQDMAAFLECYREANKPTTYVKSPSIVLSNKAQPKSVGKQSGEQAKRLEELGVSVFMPDGKAADIDWNYLAGYEQQKRDIEDTVLLALTHPDVYDSITKLTRVKQEANRPKAVLFEGPPGTGKTTSAKIIAQQVKIPLVYMPIESIMSKYYGESEKRFADIWDACSKLGRCIIFIDEIDAIAQSRSSEMHEASRRILSTLLRKIDSFESSTDVLLICATNRKQDLDAAIISRLDLSVKFELPDQPSRSAIYQRYAKHLTDKEREHLAKLSQGMSGRNISDICKDAERRWAAKLIRKEVEVKIPDVQQYIQTLNARMNSNLA